MTGERNGRLEGLAGLRNLEAQYVARGAWTDLAHLYRTQAAEAEDTSARLELLSRLAELLENELADARGAADIYGQMVSLSGDPRALGEQVRLLSTLGESGAVRAAYDDALTQVEREDRRAVLLVARGEAALEAGKHDAAREDFEAALALEPTLVQARMALVELQVGAGDLSGVGAVRAALAALPRRQPGRAALCRRLARLAELSLHDAALARWAWREVLAEQEDDEEARTRLVVLAKDLGDIIGQEEGLRAMLRQEPRGPQARQVRLELIQLLDDAGRSEDVVLELRSAVKAEPGYKDGWLALAKNAEARGAWSELVWALENAAASTEDAQERASTWHRLAVLSTHVLHDSQRAERYRLRAERLRLDDGPRPVLPRPEESVQTDSSVHVLDDRTQTPLDFPSVEVTGEHEVEEISSVEVLEPVDDEHLPQGNLIEEGPEPEAEEHAELHVEPTPPPTPSVAHPRDERELLLQAVREAPLEAEGYRALAADFRKSEDMHRADLMDEIANGLESTETGLSPPAPRLILSATDRAGLRHPALRGEAGELMGLAGPALCRLFPQSGKAGGSKTEFRLDSGKGAPAAAEALLAAVRTLGLRAPDVFLSEDNGPPFSLVCTDEGARLLVGRAAVRRELPSAELRFFAGRALFCQNPDLLALRNLSREQLVKGLSVIRQLFRGEGESSAKLVAVVDEALSPKVRARLLELLQRQTKQLPFSGLTEAARHSANRAGLVVCGGLGPVLAALREKRALQNEVLELVQFAASERFLALRSRQLL